MRSRKQNLIPLLCLLQLWLVQVIYAEEVDASVFAYEEISERSLLHGETAGFRPLIARDVCT